MHLFLIFFILYQSDAAQDVPDVNLKFYKNVTSNYTLLKEIHEAVINFRPGMLKRTKIKNVPGDYEINDKVMQEAMNIKIYSKLKYKYEDMLKKYQKHAIKRGVERLRDIPYYMSIELHIRKDTLPELNIFIRDFTKKAQQFFNELYKHNISKDIDKEFSLLDIVQTFNGFVYGEELALLNDMIFKHNVNITTDTLMIMLKHFYNEFVDNKKGDTEYLCIKFEICRPTLRFTDYIGDIAREMLMLSDIKLTDILLKLSVYIKHESDFFQLILGKSSALEIGTKLEEQIFRDLPKMRKIFINLRSYLAGRHKFTQNSDEEVNIKNKALRILVDIIDQSFDVDGDEILAMHFNMILKSIVDWSEGRNNEIEKILKAFVVQAVGLMKINLSDDAINEMHALVDILMQKEDRSKSIYKYLFNYGSTFVKGEDIPLKLSLLL